MKKTVIFSVFFLTLLLLATSGTGYAQAENKVAGVHILSPGENMEAKIRALDLRYYMDATEADSGEEFLIVPAIAGTMLETFSVEMDEDSKLRLGDRQSRLNVASENVGFVLRFHVSEGIPNLAMCIMGENRLRECWIPRYSGEDGSLILDEGFYPLRERGENENAKKYSQATGPLLDGPELIDQPHVLVERLRDSKHLADLVAEYRFVPKGELKPEMPHHFLFMPLVLPSTINLHVVTYRGGDGTIDPEPAASIHLNGDDAAVFSLDLDALAASGDSDEEYEYMFSETSGETGDTYFWIPGVNKETGRPEGAGMGPVEKFLLWPYKSN